MKTSSEKTPPLVGLFWLEVSLTVEARGFLETEYSQAETHKTLMGMGSLKAPEPDGFHVLFFKRTWNLTGKAVHSFVQGIPEGGEIPPNVNEALLVLIPKEQKATSIKNFRPISPCNVSIKLVNKMIVNRLKHVLSNLASPCQASFIPGRQSTNNVVIYLELTHSLRYTKSKKGNGAKTKPWEGYDRMEWSFVEKTLRNASQPMQMINMIIKIIQQSSCSLLWNEERTNKIKPSRDLCQGEPLSSYLFVLCTLQSMGLKQGGGG